MNTNVYSKDVLAMAEKMRSPWIKAMNCIRREGGTCEDVERIAGISKKMAEDLVSNRLAEWCEVSYHPSNPPSKGIRISDFGNQVLKARQQRPQKQKKLRTLESRLQTLPSKPGPL